MTGQICSQSAPITTQLSAIAKPFRVGSWQPKHGSVVEVWQEVGCQISNGSFPCWNWTPRISCTRAGRRCSFFVRITVKSWARDLVLSCIHVWRHWQAEPVVLWGCGLCPRLAVHGQGLAKHGVLNARRQKCECVKCNSSGAVSDRLFEHGLFLYSAEASPLLLSAAGVDVRHEWQSRWAR